MKSIFITALLLFTSIIFSQNKIFTTSDITSGSYSTLAPQKISKFQWIPGADSYSFIDKETTNDVLKRGFLKSDKKEIILRLEDLASMLRKYKTGIDYKFPEIEWADSDKFLIEINDLWFEYNLKTRKLSKKFTLPEEADNAKLSPDKKNIAFTMDNDLFVIRETGEFIQVTDTRNPDIINGQAAHRREFGIEDGIFWSDDSKKLAFYRMDQSMVTDYPIIDFTGSYPAKTKFIKYPMAGQKSHEVRIGIYDIGSGKTTWLDTKGPKDQYLANITWGPESENIYLTHINRDQNHYILKRYDPLSGKFLNDLFGEKEERYAEPLHPLYFIPGQNEKFLWLSEKDGWTHYYLCNINGSESFQLTRGEWVVTEHIGFSENGNEVFFTGTKESVLERHLYSASLEKSKIRKITDGKGVHNIRMNEQSWFWDEWESSEIPLVSRIISPDGKIVREIMRSENPVAKFDLPGIELVSFENEDNIKFYGRIYTPPGFDPEKKHPMIVYLYGGPHDQQILDEWQYGKYQFWSMRMAQEGYVVFTMDNRGSENRGKEFEQATFRQLGTIEMRDQMTGVRYMINRGFIDPARIGVFGWSYGSFMATTMLLRTDDIFKVAVGGGAVIDWAMYELMYTERYMDTPETNKEGYEKACLLNYVGNLEGKKLLLVHGTSDPTVVWQQTLVFANKAADMNKPLDYFPYVGQPHGIKGKKINHLWNKITNYFLDNL